MKKAMLSQPMGGKDKKEIIETRERAMRFLESKGYEVVNTWFTDEWYSHKNMESRGVVQIPLCFLAKSLENMSLCHVAYFAKAGKKQEDVASSTRQPKHTVLTLCMRRKSNEYICN